MESQAAIQLPCYRSHKRVWALKIKSIERRKPTIADIEAVLNGDPNPPENAAAIITPEEPSSAPFPVTAEYMRKHDPQPGGYWVRYQDGYESWSPAQAFEEGYTREN